jgi:hypothetical protein
MADIESSEKLCCQPIVEGLLHVSMVVTIAQSMRNHLILKGMDYSQWTELTHSRMPSMSLVPSSSRCPRCSARGLALGNSIASYGGKFGAVRMCGMIKESLEITITAFDNRCGVGDNNPSERMGE